MQKTDKESDRKKERKKKKEKKKERRGQTEKTEEDEKRSPTLYFPLHTSLSSVCCLVSDEGIRC